jgi:hypothetical protein
MAPEQALGKRIDRRADIWAVGAVLYRLLARRPVYDGEGQLATLQSLTTNERPKALPDGVPSGVARIIERALAFDPDQRYQSCVELKSALESALLVEKQAVGAPELSAFVTRHLGERIEGRRKALQVALEAANERSELLKLHAAEATVTALEARPEPARHWSSPPPQDGSITSSSATLDTASAGRHGVSAQRWLAFAVFAAVAAVLLIVAARYLPMMQTASGARRAADADTEDTEQASGALSAEPTAAADRVSPIQPMAAALRPSSSEASSPAVSGPTLAKHAFPGTTPRGRPKHKIVDDGF